MMDSMHHYVLTTVPLQTVLSDADSGIREFSHEESMLIAAGKQAIPEYADSRQRYLQVAVVPTEDDNRMEVRMAGAWLNFDHEGLLVAADAQSPDDEEIVSAFERQTCAELALLAEEQLITTLH